MNSIVARISYSFKGEVHTLEAVLDLDLLTADQAQVGALHGLIAKTHALDPYSYEYEVMEMAEIAFSAPQGNAVPFFGDGHFDLSRYFAARERDIDWDRLREIAAEQLGEGNLDAQSDLAAALKSAYLAGRVHGMSSVDE